MNPFSENAARLALVQQAVSLGHEGLDPLGSATLSMRWARPAADGLLLVSASACLQAQADCSAPSVDGAALAAGMSDPVLTGTLADTQSDVWADAWADGAGADERPGAGATPPAFDLSLPEWHPLDAASLAGLHGAIYTHRPEAGAVVLVASPYAATLACSRDVQLDGIPFFHPMVALSGQTHIDCCAADVYATLAGAGEPAQPVPEADSDVWSEAASAAAERAADGETEASGYAACAGRAQQMILEALGHGNACLVAHYGLLTVGPNPRAAASLARQLEALCRIYWQALQTGSVRVMPIRTR